MNPDRAKWARGMVYALPDSDVCLVTRNGTEACQAPVLDRSCLLLGQPNKRGTLTRPSTQTQHSMQSATWILHAVLSRQSVGDVALRAYWMLTTCTDSTMKLPSTGTSSPPCVSWTPWLRPQMQVHTGGPHPSHAGPGQGCTAWPAAAGAALSGLVAGWPGTARTCAHHHSLLLALHGTQT